MVPYIILKHSKSGL